MTWKDKFYDWVLESGFDCYQSGFVIDVSKDNNIYSAHVLDNMNCSIKVVMDNHGELKTASCNCSYYRKNHEYCKHIAATLFAMEKRYPNAFKESSNFKSAVYFKSDPSSYVDMGKLTKKYVIDDDRYNRALAAYENMENIDIDEFCHMDFDYDGEKEFDISFRTSASPVYLTFNKNEISSFSCYCDECMRYGYSYRDSKKLCTNKILALIIADNWLKKHNFDETNKSGYDFIHSLKNKNYLTSSNCKQQILHIFPVIEYDTYSGECVLKIKVGDVKGLVIKDLIDFINVYHNQGTYELSSKKTCDFSLVDFVDEDKPLLKYIEDFADEFSAFFEEVNERGNYFRRSRVGSLRLKQSRIDKVFDLLYGRDIEYVYKDINDKYKNIIKLSIMNNDLPISIENEYQNNTLSGISIDHEDFRFVQGNNYKYVVKEDSFSRLLCDNKVIDDLYSAGNNIKIGKNNLADFYYDYLPKLKSYPNLVVKDEMSIAENVPVRPIFKFYLDNINGVVSINALVNYKDKEYSLINLDDTDSRDVTREKVASDLIKEYFDYDLDEKEFKIKDDDSLYNLLNEGINRFKQIGEVYSTDRFDRLKNKKKVKFSFGVNLQSDLLNLSLISELPIDELANVLSSYKQKKKYHRLSSGDFVDMDDSNLNKLLSLKEEMNITDKKFAKGEINLPTYRVLSLNDELNEFTGVELNRDEKFVEFVDKFDHIDISDYKLPSGINAKLRPYQEYGFKWLNVLYDCGFGGILADEMGLGKTLQIITLLEYRKEIGEDLLSLIVTPASLVYNWYAEFEKFAPSIKVGMIAGNKEERSATLLDRENYDVLITSYDLLKRDLDLYEDISFDVEVIDEAQYIKNQSTGAAKAVKEINSKKHFALTGTPIENRLSELWSIFDYLMSDYLYSYEYFKKHFELKIVNEKDEEASLSLKKMIGPFVLRRRKVDVLDDLPEKIEKVYYAEFDKAQREIYDAQIMKISKLVEKQDASAFSKNKIAVLAELTKTRQICCDPSLIFDNYLGTSAKKETCLELIKESIDGGHKMLIFSQFTSMLELLEEKLNEDNIKYYKITGATDKKERLDLCNKFNNDDIPVFLISLKAGGTGLNLIGADIVIHYDPWWNEAVISQATDRTHRIGQKNTVTVYKLIAKGTIEEKILKLQEDKKNLADEILSGANTSLTSLSREELLDLLKGD